MSVLTRAPSIGPPTPVEIGQMEWEFEHALELYRLKAPAKVLEIGTWAGGTLYHWLRNAEPGALVVTVDSKQPDTSPFDEWCPPDVNWLQVVGNSHSSEVIGECEIHGPYDWLFIDGCHVYEDAQADWENYKALCAPGAVVLFHDISLRREYPEQGKEAGVWRLWREIQAEGFMTQELRVVPELTEYGIGVCHLP